MASKINEFVESITDKIEDNDNYGVKTLVLEKDAMYIKCENETQRVEYSELKYVEFNKIDSVYYFEIEAGENIDFLDIIEICDESRIEIAKNMYNKFMNYLPKYVSLGEIEHETDGCGYSISIPSNIEKYRPKNKMIRSVCFYIIFMLVVCVIMKLQG